MFMIVKFLPKSDRDVETVDIVPRHWIFEEDYKQMCYWPDVKNTNRHVVQLSEPEDNWLKFRITVLNKTPFLTYEAARKKLPMAENQSDLSSCEESPVRKRSINPPQYYADEYEPVPAKRGHSSTVSSNRTTAKEIPFEMPKLVLVQPDSAVTMHRATNSNRDFDSNSEINLDFDDLPTVLPAGETNTIPSEEISGMLRVLLDNQDKIMKNQVYLKLSVTNLERKFDDVASFVISHNRETTSDVEVLVEPFSDKKEFIKFNTELMECQETSMNFKKQLQDFGGNTVSDCVNKIMKKLMTPILADEYSVFGLGKNNCNFSTTAVYKHIVAALKSSKRYDESKTTSALVEWFRRSGARLAKYREKHGLN